MVWDCAKNWNTLLYAGKRGRKRMILSSAFLAALLLLSGCGKESGRKTGGTDHPPKEGSERITELSASESGSLIREESGGKEKPRTDFHLNEEPIAVNRGEQLTIGFSQIGAESDWRLASSASMEQVFTSDNGYNLIFSDGQQKQENQIKAIREFIGQGQDVDYIILDPMTEYGWDSSLQEAKDAGIPVIIVDREVKVEDENLYTVWAGSDFRLEGDRACAWLEAFLETQPGLKDEKIGIVDVQGTLDASAQIGRSDALLEAVKKHENWELLAVECGDFVQAKGREVMEQMLKEYGSRINVVYCENDNMAYGVLEALENAGMKAGTDLSSGEVLVISFDAARQGLEKTLQGEIAVDTECNPLYGPILSRIIMALEQGDELPKRNYFEEKQFSSLDTVSEAVVNDSSYPVVMLTEELILGREY